MCEAVEATDKLKKKAMLMLEQAKTKAMLMLEEAKTKLKEA